MEPTKFSPTPSSSDDVRPNQTAHDISGPPAADDSSLKDSSSDSVDKAMASHSSFGAGSGDSTAPSKPSWAQPAGPATTPGAAMSDSDGSSPMMSNGGAPGGMVSPKVRKKGLFAGLMVGAVAIVLLGGSAAAYFGYYVPNKPANVLKAALVAEFSRDSVKSTAFDGEVSMTDTSSDQTFSGTFKGSASQTGAFDVTADIDAMVTKVNVDVRSVDGKTFYVKLGGLDGLPELLKASGDSAAAMYAPMLKSINNQWFEINESLIKQFAGNSYTGKQLSDADLKKLGDAYSQHQFLVVQKAMADEKIKGVNSHHYKVVVNPAELKNFFKAVKDANIDALKLTDEQLSSFNKVVDSAHFDKYPVDLWIGKSDKLIHQLSFSTTQDNMKVDLRYTVDSINQPVNVEKPADAKSILEVLSQIFMTSGLTGGSSSSTDSTQMQDMMQQLQSGVSL